MNITSSHARAVIAYDITVNVKASSGEYIREVRVKINGEPMATESIPVSTCTTWVRSYPQKGDYPGTTRLHVTATNDKGQSEDYLETWGPV
ncbi:MAG TPA: hypothetical protein VFB81_07065 [Myxococcales bacterium]|nr:hypothetical protein [Myxococcales bacterium]